MDWVHYGVKTISSSILINGEPKDLIHPTSGITQGDPLSPFLFLLCTEGLHGLISNVASCGEIIGFSLCKRDPKLTHLLFVDVSLYFAGPQRKNVKKSSSSWKSMSMLSRQKMNKSKTTLFFSRSTLESVRLAIKDSLGL